MFFNSHKKHEESGIKMEPINRGNNSAHLDDLEGAEFGSFENNRTNANGQASQQVQISMENDVNMAQLREREAALRKLENDIVDVNMIFKDLAVMVHDQGEIIDSIESNVEAVQIRVTEANSHLESAKRHQVSFLLFDNP